MWEFLQYEFMQRALIAAVLVSVACGLVGSYVVIKRIVFISGGISHTAFGGIGLGFLLGVNPIITAIPFCIISALGIGLIQEKRDISEDTAIGILWTVGMALGVIFVGLTPGYAPDLMSYLFGSILTVPLTDLYIMLVLDVLIIILVTLFYRPFQWISFDPEYAQAIGLPVRWLSLLLLALVALSVVVLLKVVGVILVIALLTIPAAISKQYTYQLSKLMIISIILGLILTIMGLWLSFTFDLASGATIVLVMGLAFIIASYIKD